MSQTVTDVSQLPNIVNLRRKRGDTFPWRMAFTNQTSGTPVDLTGTTVLFTLNELIDPTDTVLQKFQLTGAIIGAPTDGVVEFTMTATQADLVGTFFYDVQRTVGLDKRTLAEGSFEFTQDITKT